MTITQQFSFPFAPPATSGRTVRTKWQELTAMAEAGSKCGGFVPQNIAAVLLDVSRQRVHNMIADGLFPTHEWFGKTYLAVDDLAAYVNREVKEGRPVGMPPATFRETLTRMKASAREKG